MSTAERIRFYFSFRSPYAWLAAEQLHDVFGELGVTIEPRAIYPDPQNFPNDPTRVPEKGRYFIQDVVRHVRRLGLTVSFPKVVDLDWSLSHAACTAASEEGRGLEFALEAFRKRWSEGADLGDDAVIADAARSAGLDPDNIVAAGHDQENCAKAAEAWGVAVEEDQIFGVPSFIYRDKLYWGQDRMHFVRDAVLRARAPTG